MSERIITLEEATRCIKDLHERVATLERAGADSKLDWGKGSTVSFDDVRGIYADKATPATVERFRMYGFKQSQYYVRPTGADDQYLNHFARLVIGAVVATRDNNGWWRLCFEPNKWSSVYSQEQYEWLVDMMLKSGVWERIE